MASIRNYKNPQLSDSWSQYTCYIQCYVGIQSSYVVTFSMICDQHFVTLCCCAKHKQLISTILIGTILRSLQIARAAAVFSVDEVVVFDEAGTTHMGWVGQQLKL